MTAHTSKKGQTQIEGVRVSGETRVAGRDDNRVYVITDTHDMSDARDVLEGILASDRWPHRTASTTLRQFQHPPSAS